uniref:Uncharacterized protein n=1 Tax=Cacopsylla melanoneura TaxID=428564 RepID=A0A8D8YZH6_9HEMI
MIELWRMLDILRFHSNCPICYYCTGGCSLLESDNLTCLRILSMCLCLVDSLASCVSQQSSTRLRDLISEKANQFVTRMKYDVLARSEERVRVGGITGKILLTFLMN